MPKVHYISRFTGLPITELEHVGESIADILTTPLRTRARLMEYGSGIYGRVDDPVNRGFVADIRMDVAVALDRWEPRVKVEKVDLDLSEVRDGVVYVSLVCIYKPTGDRVRFDRVELRFRRIAA